MGISKVVKKYNINNQPTDFSYWQAKSYQERIAALEQIRLEYNSWRYERSRVKLHCVSSCQVVIRKLLFLGYLKVEEDKLAEEIKCR